MPPCYAHGRRAMVWARRALSGCALLASAFVAKTASATVSVAEANVDRTTKMRDSSSYPLYISKSDCAGSDAFVFPLQISSDVPTSAPLEVWVGDGSADCSFRTSREPNGGCKRIDDQSRPVSEQKNGVMELEIPSSSIAAAAGAENCEDSGGTSAPRAIGIYFLVVDDAGAAQLTQYAVWTKTSIDLTGPPPPKDVKVASAENALSVTWDQTENDDIQGYYVYCDVALGSDGSGGAGGDGGSANAGGSGGSMSEGGSPGEGGAASSSGGAADGTDGACASALLKAGSPAPSETPCATVGRSSEALAEGLVNATRYAVAVAAHDAVGNAGNLSALACGEPAPVDDFFELYRRYGGQAGGGFCGYAGAPRGAATAMTMLGAVAALSLLARRARRGGAER